MGLSRAVNLQKPLVPKESALPSSDEYSMSLLEGIRDVHHWGKTPLTAGKFQKSNISYEEIVGSSNVDHQSYCKFMMSQKD